MKYPRLTLNYFKLITIVIVSLTNFAGYSAEVKHSLDIQVRADDKSNKDLRFQYRIRYKPSVTFSDTWSAHSFITTGDEFSSSHNTLDDGAADYFYVRRLYGRHTGNYGKTEFGIIPTYKGRVSSSGLSKDGWIQGVRHVRAIHKDTKLELVAGQLESLDTRDALALPGKLDYLELEYSASITDSLSYELSLERMTSLNYVRTELRYQYLKQHTIFAELIKRANANKIKGVLGIEGKFLLANKAYEYFAHYSYVSKQFGLRAELTEDFLATGNGISVELESQIGQSDFDWFIRFDGVSSQSRFLAGLKWSL